MPTTVLGAGLVQYIRRCHYRWVFLGVCPILDVFQIFVVLEVKDLLEFQSTRTKLFCSGRQQRRKAARVKSTTGTVMVLEWILLTHTRVERLAVCVKNDDGGFGKS